MIGRIDLDLVESWKGIVIDDWKDYGQESDGSLLIKNLKSYG
jgi:hypothetical protein